MDKANGNFHVIGSRVRTLSSVLSLTDFASTTTDSDLIRLIASLRQHAKEAPECPVECVSVSRTPV